MSSISIIVALIAIGAFAAFIVWRIKEKQNRPKGSGSGGGPGKGNWPKSSLK
jgi:hypothetical protein